MRIFFSEITYIHNLELSLKGVKVEMNKLKIKGGHLSKIIATFKATNESKVTRPKHLKINI